MYLISAKLVLAFVTIIVSAAVITYTHKQLTHFQSRSTAIIATMTAHMVGSTINNLTK
jgi:hypothetical protein